MLLDVPGNPDKKWIIDGNGFVEEWKKQGTGKKENQPGSGMDLLEERGPARSLLPDGAKLVIRACPGFADLSGHPLILNKRLPPVAMPMSTRRPPGARATQ